MKKFLLALLTAVTAAALLCGAAAVSTYSVGYDAPAGISTIVVQDSSAAVVLQAADIDHIHADYTYTSSYAFESSKLYDFSVAGSTLTVTKTREPNTSLTIKSTDTRARMALLQIAQNENLVPTEEDIDKTLSERAERTKKTLEEIKAASNVEAIRRNEGIRRAADYVIEHSTIEEK